MAKSHLPNEHMGMGQNYTTRIWFRFGYLFLNHSHMKPFDVSGAGGRGRGTIVLLKEGISLSDSMLAGGVAQPTLHFPLGT